MRPTAYRVRLDAFEGPLDLLLHLVKTNEVDIYNLPIATVTDQYLEYLGMFEELNLDVAGEYLVMAATLMYLKSRLLLPTSADDDEEEGIDLDPGTDLVRQLAEYQRFKEAAEGLADRARLGRDVFRRAAMPASAVEPEDPGFRPVGMPTLFEALRRVLAVAAARRPHTVAAEEYSVADAVRRMVNILHGRERIDFRYLFDEGAPRGLVIATFCGLLEMIKLHIVEAEQHSTSETIYLRLVSDNPDEVVASLTQTYGQGEGHVHHHQAADEAYHDPAGGTVGQG
jgi:segregation and condensation protein A